MHFVVHTNYIRQQEAVIEYLRSYQLHPSGNGYCESPVYSAKYGSYTLMDSATDRILDYSLVQVSEMDSSVTMEKEGLQHSSLQALDSRCHNHFCSYRQTYWCSLPDEEGIFIC